MKIAFVPAVIAGPPVTDVTIAAFDEYVLLMAAWSLVGFTSTLPFTGLVNTGTTPYFGSRVHIAL